MARVLLSDLQGLRRGRSQYGDGADFREGAVLLKGDQMRASGRFSFDDAAVGFLEERAIV